MTWEMVHFLPQILTLVCKKFGGGKILAKDFLFFMTWEMVHFLPQILTLVCKIEIIYLLRIYYVLSSVLCRGV
jgi:hypothetical protein